MTTETILIAVITLFVGAVVGYLISTGRVKSLKAEKEKEADEIIKKAERTAEDRLRPAKTEAKQVIADEKEVEHAKIIHNAGLS